jgi:hypothetical protein
VLVTTDDRAIIRICVALEPSTPVFEGEAHPALREMLLLETIDLGLADDRLNAARIYLDDAGAGSNSLFLRYDTIVAPVFFFERRNRIFVCDATRSPFLSRVRPPPHPFPTKTCAGFAYFENAMASGIAAVLRACAGDMLLCLLHFKV